MSDRDAIFKSVRSSLAKSGGGAPLPDYEADLVVAKPRLEGSDLWAIFAKNFAAVNGKPMKGLDEVVNFLKGEGTTRGYCAPELAERFVPLLEEAGIEISDVYDRLNYDDYQFGITRAAGAIAETGTVVLTDSSTADRLGALTPWIHIAVLSESDLIETVGGAIASFDQDETNIVWATGPSKTADIEGILIEGVHGPGEQVCLLAQD